MTARRLGILLLAVVVGVGLGALAAYATQPRGERSGMATPVPAQSPSVPIDEPTKSSLPPPAPDIDFPTLSTDLRLNAVHTIHNGSVKWQYHVPEGWTAYSACRVAPCPIPYDGVVPPKRVDKLDQVRFRPAGEPVEGGYSIRVRVLDSAIGFNVGQLTSARIAGFDQTYKHFTSKVTDDGVDFTYRDGENHERLNYFAWYTAPGAAVPSIEVSVAGRVRDKAGLHWLLDRFADNLTYVG